MDRPPGARAGRGGVDEGTAQRTVLVVDDDPDIVDSVREVLERFVPGVQVATAKSASAGLALLRALHVDLVLVDYKMPGRNGLEFLERAQELEPGLPVILMTGFGSVDVAARAVNRHRVQGFLPKPFDAVVLADTVQAALRRAKDR